MSPPDPTRSRKLRAKNGQVIQMAAVKKGGGFEAQKGKGRPKGAKNKFGQEAKEAFALAFEGLGGVPALTQWARRNPETFYKLYSKLIPVELHGTGDGLVQIVISDKEAKL